MAWLPLGWQCVGVAERERFPCAVLAHHYPDVPNLGDVTADDFLERAAALKPDVLVGGPPCQDFSVAGLRAGIHGARGNLTLRWVQIIHAARPSFAVTENVPGWLSANKGHAFGAFLAGLVGHDTALVPPKEAGGRWTDAGMVDGPDGRAAWRILDAQYFGLAQRRRRVFVIFCPRNGGDPAAVLFERQGVRGHIAPGREAQEGVAPTISSRPTGGGGLGTDFDLDGGLISHTLSAARGAACAHAADLETYVPVAAFGGNNTAGPIDISTAVNAHGGPHGRLDFESETFVTHALRADGFDASEDGTGRGTPIVPVCCDTTQITSKTNRSNPQAGDPCHTLARGADAPAIAFSCKDHGADAGEITPTMRAMGHAGSHPNAGGQIAVHAGHAVRRLTPSECEALQGFRRNYTRIPMRHYKTRKITKNRPEDRWEKDPTGGWWLMSCDGERYKALGNSMATPCMAWIGRRIIATS